MQNALHRYLDIFLNVALDNYDANDSIISYNLSYLFHFLNQHLTSSCHWQKKSIRDETLQQKSVWGILNINSWLNKDKERNLGKENTWRLPLNTFPAAIFNFTFLSPHLAPSLFFLCLFPFILPPFSFIQHRTASASQLHFSPLLAPYVSHASPSLVHPCPLSEYSHSPSPLYTNNLLYPHSLLCTILILNNHSFPSRNTVQPTEFRQQIFFVAHHGFNVLIEVHWQWQGKYCAAYLNFQKTFN